MHYATDVSGIRPEGDTVRYNIDAKASRFTVQAFAGGMLAAFGHDPIIAIRDFDGYAEFTPGDPAFAGAALHISIRADSLEVTDDIADKDRAEIEHKMRSEVLETKRFSEIRYDCNKIQASGNSEGRYWLALNGDLTLHGETAPLNIPARLVVNGDGLRASGEFTLRQTDFGIKLVSAAAGTVRIKDELRFSFDMVARKQG